MTKAAGRTVVGTTAVRVAGYAERRSSLAIRNTGTAAIYIDTEPGVTTADGFLVDATQTVVFSRENGDDPTIEYFAVSGSAGQSVATFEMYTGEERVRQKKEEEEKQANA